MIVGLIVSCRPNGVEALRDKAAASAKRIVEVNGVQGGVKAKLTEMYVPNGLGLKIHCQICECPDELTRRN